MFNEINISEVQVPYTESKLSFDGINFFPVNINSLDRAINFLHRFIKDGDFDYLMYVSLNNKILEIDSTYFGKTKIKLYSETFFDYDEVKKITVADLIDKLTSVYCDNVII